MDDIKELERMSSNNHNIVTTPFTGYEEEIAASFIIESGEASTNLLKENATILTDTGTILIESVCTTSDNEYTTIETSTAQNSNQFNIVPEEANPKGKKTKRSRESDSSSHPDPANPTGVDVDEFTCPYCLKSFQTIKNKMNHMRIMHHVTFREVKGYVRCVECDLDFGMVNKLRKHLRHKHGMVMTEEVHKFSNMESFRVWKRNLEKSEGEFFTQQYGPKKRFLGQKWGFICHRSGKQKDPVKDTMRKRMHRNQGSYKMNIHCTAGISVEQRANEVVVKYWPQHYGHVKEIKCEEEILGDVYSDVPLIELLEDVCENVKGERIKQWKEKGRDVKAIKHAFDIEEYNPCLTDSESVDRWVSLCLQMDDSPVLCYRRDEHGNAEEEFILVIMTEFQKQLLVSTEKKVINLDCVHRRNGARFYLTCISIMDECDVALPVAFCISNKIDKYVVRSFLMSVRESTGPLSCTYFMSDSDNMYFSAWKDVMNDESVWLWSMWYFDYNIHRRLRCFKNDILRKAETYKTLRTLIECQSQGIFEAAIKKFIASLVNNPTSKNLGDFLQKKYGATTKHWAYCYRTDLKPTANFQLDALHRTLRFCCREGRKKRLDKFITVLMKFIKMKMLDRLMNYLDDDKIEMAVEGISICHEEGLAIPTDSVLSLSDKIWLIRYSDELNNVYVVRDYDSCPYHCKLRCADCDICVHMYSCSCIPSVANANLCQHIHAVVWKFLTPHFSPLASPMMPQDMDGNDDFQVSEKVPDELENVLKKTHDIYKKVRRHKWDLNSESLALIMKGLEELENSIDEGVEKKNLPPEEIKLKRGRKKKNELGPPSTNTRPNIVVPQVVQNTSSALYSLLTANQPLNQPQTMNNSSQTFSLPNQSSAVLPQNGQNMQPYILILPHGTRIAQMKE